MSEKMDILESYPTTVNTTVEGIQQLPSTQTSIEYQQLMQKQKSALYSAIGGVVCLLAGWFMFGLFFGFMAAGCGWTALKEGNTGTKIMGMGVLIGGVLYILLSFGMMFYI